MMKRPWRAAAGAGAVSTPPGGLVRSKTGAESIRGRISSPIPIPNPLDEEFPMRNPGTGIALPVGAEAEQPKADQARPDTFQPQPQAITTSTPTGSPARRATIPSHASIDADAATPSPVPMSSTRNSPARRTNTSTVRQSTISMESGGTSSAKLQPQRKKSTLRGALGRLFGRKKKNGPADDDTGFNDSSTPTVSDPLPTNHNDDQKRFTALPVSQYDRALRSHSIGPEDVLAIESARNSLSADLGLSKRRTGDGFQMHLRRATDGGWTGLSPRPASSQGRISRQDRHNSDPEEIGRAITCDTTAKRRRSRSLSGLPNVEEDRDGRRRSDDIRYWRQSYDPNFVPPVVIQTDDQDAGANAVGGDEMGADEEGRSPVEPFSFPNMGAMKELAGMKITQAVSMDTRIGSLEARMRRIESVIAQLCNAVPNFKPQLEFSGHPAPPTSAAGMDLRGSTRPSTQQSEMSRTSFGDATYVGSVPRSTVMPPVMTFHRPMSLATIRGATSLPTISKDIGGPLTMDHYSKLVELIEAERSARRTLEAQVKTLSHQIHAISHPSMGVRDLGNPPPTGKSFAQRSAFDVDDDDEENDPAHSPKRYRQSLGLEDSGIATGGIDDDDYSESFATPHEHANGFSAIGDDFDEDDLANRKTARTMSLSQITIGKGALKTTHDPPPQPVSP